LNEAVDIAKCKAFENGENQRGKIGIEIGGERDFDVTSLSENDLTRLLHDYIIFLSFHRPVREESNLVFNLFYIVRSCVMSSINGYTDYQRREYCKDISCEVQLDLEKQDENSEGYQKVRNICQTACRHTTYEFHQWLINKGYLVVRPD